MKRVFKLLIITIIFTIVTNAKMPNVLIRADKTTIKSGKDVKIVLGVQALKNSKVKLPEIKSIAGYGIKNRRVSTTVTKLAGKDVLTKAITYTISPTKSFTIKPYSVEINKKTYKTNSINVKVIQDIKPKSNGGFIFKMSSSKKDIVVGETFIVGVELIEPIDASSADLRYTAPAFKGFKTTSLGDGDIKEQGKTVVRSLKYLATATKPGKFTISPARAKIGMQMTPQTQSPFGFFGADIQWKNLSSNSIDLNVHQKPNGVKVVGNYKIKASVDKNRVKASKPLTYTLIIEGEGNLNDFEDLKINIPNVTQYSKDSNIEHRFENGKVYTKYTKKYVFISRVGYTIPKITINAYNPNNHRVYPLKAKAVSIAMSKTKSISSLLNRSSSEGKEKNILQKSIPAQADIPITQQSAENSKIENILFDKEYYKRKYSKNISGLLNIVIALLVGLLLGALGGIFIPRFIKTKKAQKGNKLYGSYKEAMHILYPHIDKDKKIEEMVKFLYEVVNGNKEIVINDRVLNKMVKKVIN